MLKRPLYRQIVTLCTVALVLGAALPSHAQESSCEESKVRAQNDANANVDASGWAVGGAAGGLACGCIGGGIIYMMAGNANEPTIIPQGVNSQCYKSAYVEQANKLRKQKACNGALIGIAGAVVINMILFSAQ